MAQLFLRSYDGNISTLHFSEGASPKDALKLVVSTKACSPNPSLITIDAQRQILYCTRNDRETFTGRLQLFSVKNAGILEEKSSVSAPFGAAYHTLSNRGNALAVAYYYAGRVGIYDVEDTRQIKTAQELDFPNFVPGPGRDQDISRPHQAILDPSGSQVLVTDLGAGLIRLFTVGSPHQVQEVGGFDFPKGSFPRHVAVVTLRDRTQLYVLIEPGYQHNFNLHGRASRRRYLVNAQKRR
ncbi:hypothetical protein H2200_012347 [Cladophialophora chaetospira]|uniref:6-phosphogluconolactonase n=1 Tax=Cladophialophora chaetospira TaxID=386627 RepID=A0AA39CCB4_9EURO|nr:hypothetical protein H2200_012347 [Cladophialophora chaetospira]